MPGLNFEKRGEKGEHSNINLGEYKPRDNFHPMGKLSGLDGLGLNPQGEMPRCTKSDKMQSAGITLLEKQNRNSSMLFSLQDNVWRLN